MSEKPTCRLTWSPFGRHTRYMFGGYLRHVLTVLSILLAIGLTIDLWPQFQEVAAHGGSGLSATWQVLRFAALRTPGIIAPLIPFATFLGVVWTEVIHTQTGERMLVWNSGRSPLQSLAPALLLGIVLGATNFTLDGILGPASMALQMHEQLGRDGAAMDRSKITPPKWIALPEGLLKARISYGPPSSLVDMALFKRDSDGRLIEVDTAPVARRDAASGVWRLYGGQYWSAGDQPKLVFGSASRQTMIPFTERDVRLSMDPLWLAYYDLGPQYIPLPVLMRLSHSEDVPDAHGQYATRYYVVMTEAVLPVGMALLAASLAMLMLAYRCPPQSVIGIVFAGYAAHFAIKAGLILGQNGFVSPFLAAFTVPGLLFGAVGVVLLICERQRRNRRPLTAS